MNVHAPERQPDETQAQYRQRQRDSNSIVRTMRKGPTQQPWLRGMPSPNWVHYWTGQHKATAARQLNP